MNALTLLKQQYDHMSWADSKIWQATLTLAENKADSKIRDLLYHLHTTQYAFLYIWQEKPLVLPNITKFK